MNAFSIWDMLLNSLSLSIHPNLTQVCCEQPSEIFTLLDTKQDLVFWGFSKSIFR